MVANVSGWYPLGTPQHNNIGTLKGTEIRLLRLIYGSGGLGGVGGTTTGCQWI